LQILSSLNRKSDIFSYYSLLIDIEIILSQ
jgi:hypothetical protein